MVNGLQHLFVLSNFSVVVVGTLCNLFGLVFEILLTCGFRNLFWNVNVMQPVSPDYIMLQNFHVLISGYFFHS